MERRGVVPMLAVRNGFKALEFYSAVFDAIVSEVYEDARKLGHANVVVFGQTFMLADEYPDFQAIAPQMAGGAPVTMHLEVPDVDQVSERMIAGGAKRYRGPEDTGLGFRIAKLEDPFGHFWFLSGPLR